MLPKSKRDCTEQGVTEYAQLKAEKKVEEIVELQNAPKIKTGLHRAGCYQINTTGGGEER